ncbi:MAG TPA: 5-dehydro-2-deoxygluconokinase, partial [Afifellaceae bacterium]|nr:5-dehydro-2-deoxygluconokinase [Afifellaceae bacterium]
MDADGSAPHLDVIAIGRSSVDLYGQQIGSRLEDVATFAKSVGGCPSNIAIGTARLGLKSGLITRVGDEQMGRYILEQMARENVATNGIVTDPERLTALVLLSVENDETFPLIFYRENCADMALCEDDIDAGFVASARAVLVSGTHFSHSRTEAAQRKAMRIARNTGGKIAFDIDYRPNLWGLAGHGAGEARYIASERVSRRLKTVLADCDLVVGTEEEIHIAAGEEDTLAALRAIRDISDATIVLKRGPMGCVVYPDAIPDRIEDGIVGAGYPVEVYNVLGAGDAFMSGFLRGWLRDEPLATCAGWANACGAFAVSRLLCSPESPTWTELQYFLENGSPHRALGKDQAINHIHWSTTRRPQPPGLMALAIDHRAQMQAMADQAGAPLERISAFKTLAVEAAIQVAAGRPGYGVLLDETYGRKAMVPAAEKGLWIGRPVEEPGSRPLRFEVSQDIGSRINEWPPTHTVKCLAFFHPDDDAALKERQAGTLKTLYEAARRTGRELLIEIIASKNGPLGDDTTARVLEELYAHGIKPDWWKLEPQAGPAAWRKIDTVIAASDPWCRGIVLLGLEAPEDKLLEGFAACAGIPLVRGFAIGR